MTLETTRIHLGMTLQEVMVAMSEGNPGALRACSQIEKYGDIIDPDSFAGGLSALIALDSLKIYGDRIYLLWDKVCNRDTSKMIAVLRAYQLGYLAEAAIYQVINNCGIGLDLDAVVFYVKTQLPRFTMIAQEKL